MRCSVRLPKKKKKTSRQVFWILPRTAVAENIFTTTDHRSSNYIVLSALSLRAIAKSRIGAPVRTDVPHTSSGKGGIQNQGPCASALTENGNVYFNRYLRAPRRRSRSLAAHANQYRRHGTDGRARPNRLHRGPRGWRALRTYVVIWAGGTRWERGKKKWKKKKRFGLACTCCARTYGSVPLRGFPAGLHERVQKCER